MSSYLVFQLRGDLASWGDIAVGEQRPTLPFPTKSAVIGLIAAALGIKRDEEEKQLRLAKSIRYGVKVFLPESDIAGYNNERFTQKKTYSGGYLRDYQTIQSPSETDIRLFAKKYGRRPSSRYDELQALKLGKSEGTILSFREYRLDPYYIVAISIQDDFVSLEQIREAFYNPKFHLYLGRKSCPLNFPLSPVLVQAETIQDAVKYASLNHDQFENLDDFGLPSLNSCSQIYFEVSDICDSECIRIEEYRAVPTSRLRWQFETHSMGVIGV